MKKLTALIVFFLVSYGSFAGNIWYVSDKGDDGHDGKTLITAFRSLQKAADIVKPGDVVMIGEGKYTNSDKESNGAVLSIKNSGSPDAWITWKSIPGCHPEINPTGWAGIQITGSYHILDGLTVMGENDAIVLLEAQNDAKKVVPDPYFNTNGIFINGRRNAADAKPHHIIIRNCIVGKCPGGGIAAIECDYITIEDCKIFNNAWFMRYGGSGISTLTNWAYDDAPGYHVVIQRNYVWNNRTYVSWEKIGHLSDGNGIILDVTDNDEDGAANPNADAFVKSSSGQVAPSATPPLKPRRPEWKGRTLVACNLSAYNGGSGIHTFRTKHADIINNTTYWNGINVGYPELFANTSDDITIFNNIIVPRPKGKVTANHKNGVIRWDYNLYPVSQDLFKGEHDIISDPEFLNVQNDFTKADFRLSKSSRGLKSGTDAVPQLKDIDKKNRLNTKRDRGAFQQ